MGKSRKDNETRKAPAQVRRDESKTGFIRGGAASLAARNAGQSADLSARSRQPADARTRSLPSGFPQSSVVHSGSPQGSLGSAHSGLLQTIEGEVIPRLLLAHQAMLREQASVNRAGGDVMWSENAMVSAPAQSLVQDSHDCYAEMVRAAFAVSQDDVVAFANLLITQDANVAKHFIDTQVARGYAVPDLLLDLCAPAARELGDMWMRDDCSFCDVTIGLSSLEHVILHCTGHPVSHPVSKASTANGDRTALLSAMPGNQHVFGLLIVKELFRRSGWTVSSPKSNDSKAVLDAVRTKRFGVLGLSVGSRDDLQDCQELLKACRAESLNKKLLIIVGGHAIQEANPATRMLDADLIARDGREGLDQIERIISRLAPKQPMN